MTTREEGIKERSKREKAEQDSNDLKQIMGWHNGENGLVMNSDHAMHVLADEVQRLRESLIVAHDMQVGLEKENERLKQAIAYIERHAIEIAVKRECRQALQPNETTTEKGE